MTNELDPPRPGEPGIDYLERIAAAGYVPVLVPVRFDDGRPALYGAGWTGPEVARFARSEDLRHRATTALYIADLTRRTAAEDGVPVFPSDTRV